MKLWKKFREQDGAVAIMVAVSAIVLLGFAAFVIGTWNGQTRAYNPNATPPNAVRVRTRRDSTTNGPIQTFLGGIFGVTSISLAKPATAALTGLGSVSKGDI